MARLAVVVGLLVVAPDLVAQRPAGAPPGAATSIRGRIVDAVTGAPLVRAALVVFMSDSNAERILTDDHGRFDVPVATTPAIVRVSKAGYATTMVTVEGTGAAPSGDIALPRAAAITGRVVDDNGQGVAQVFVRARRSGTPGAASDPGRFVAATDDRGEYRLGGLPEGRYAVGLTALPPSPAPGGDQLLAFIEGAARGVADEASAMRAVVLVDVRRGEEVTGIDLRTAMPWFGCALRAAVTAESDRETGAVRGRVTSASGQPLSCARVLLLRPGTSSTAFIRSTDAQGRYEFSGVPAGSFVVQGRATGHVSRYYGQRPTEQVGAAVDVRDRQVVTRIDISLPRAPVIAGTVLDEHGEPVEGVLVKALQIGTADGRLTALPAPGAPPHRTNDRGEYRLFGLEPGTYLVAATLDALVAGAGGAPARGYAPMFFPGTPDPASAAQVRIDVGADAAGLTLVLARSATARVAGTALDRLGRPFAGTVVLAVSERSGAMLLEPRQARAVGGAFAFDNVPPGDYVVQAFDLDRDARQFGMQYVSVIDRDPPPIVLSTSAGPTIEFRVVFEGVRADQPVPPAALPVPADFDRAPLTGARSSTPGMFPITIGVGRFRVTAATGPRRFVLQSPWEIAGWFAARQHDRPVAARREAFESVADTWYLESARVNGADALDAPFDFGLTDTVFRDVEIVVSPAGAVVEGQAVDERGRPVADYAVVAFSMVRDHWFPHSRHIKSASSTPDGRFRIAGLPPGEYYVAAVTGLDGTPATGEWQDPAVLEALVPGAHRITLAKGARETARVRLIRR